MGDWNSIPDVRLARSRAERGLAEIPSRVFELAARVIERADRDHPADAVLRDELRLSRGLPPEMSRAVARLTFGYYRWFGWVDQSRPVAGQLRHTIELMERYQGNPEAFSHQDRIDHAVPKWVAPGVERPDLWMGWMQGEPKLWLRARPGQRRELGARLGECVFPEDTRLADALEYRGSRDLFRTPEFHRGEFEVQDLSSQAVGWVCHPQPGEIWWDACAGEGGKTLHLADLMKNQGLIWASDRAGQRLQRLRRRMARARLFNYRMVQWAGGPQLPTKTGFDGVLLDAPCSGIGTWLRNPHARWTTVPKDVFELAAIQRGLLHSMASAVRPGGKLIYAVCTLTRAETIERVTDFNEAFPEFELWPTPSPFGSDGGPESTHWFWPNQCGANGMFVAVWRRRGSDREASGGLAHGTGSIRKTNRPTDRS